MPIVHLTDRAQILVSGAEAETFLQNLITTDLATLPESVARAGALLTPQGKIMFDFLIRRADEGFAIDIRSSLADDLARRLTLYRLRAKVDFAVSQQPVVAVVWQDDSAASHDDSTVQDGRFPEEAGIFRVYGSAPESNASIAEWDALRARYGIAESGSDFEAGDAFPHDVLYDQMGGVGLRKGCYVGQEVVSRMHHRGTARRRVLIVDGEGALPASGTSITVNGRPVGVLGTVAGQSGLAILRIDKVKDAMDAGTPILAGDVAIRASIPDWAAFRFPESPAAESE